MLQEQADTSALMSCCSLVCVFCRTSNWACKGKNSVDAGQVEVEVASSVVLFLNRFAKQCQVLTGSCACESHLCMSALMIFAILQVEQETIVRFSDTQNGIVKSQTSAWFVLLQLRLLLDACRSTTARKEQPACAHREASQPVAYQMPCTQNTYCKAGSSLQSHAQISSVYVDLVLPHCR